MTLLTFLMYAINYLSAGETDIVREMNAFLWIVLPLLLVVALLPVKLEDHQLKDVLLLSYMHWISFRRRQPEPTLGVDVLNVRHATFERTVDIFVRFVETSLHSVLAALHGTITNE